MQSGTHGLASGHLHFLVPLETPSLSFLTSPCAVIHSDFLFCRFDHSILVSTLTTARFAPDGAGKPPGWPATARWTEGHRTVSNMSQFDQAMEQEAWVYHTQP
jgi:hypothetical protein